MIPCRRRATHHLRVLQPLREMQPCVFVVSHPFGHVHAKTLGTCVARRARHRTPRWRKHSCRITLRSIGLRPARNIAAEENEMMFGILRATAAAIVLASAGVAAPTQNVADFYKGRNVELYIGYSVGGGYDLWARVLARHIGHHIPGNPTIVVKNMEGAGSLRLANWLYRIGPKDGSVFGIIGRGTGFDPLLGQQAAQFDATKFTWIGSGNHEVSVCVSFEDRAGITTFDDLRTKQITVRGTGASADTDQFPKVVNGVLGTKIKIVTRYPAANNVVLAMERGELQGRCGWSWSSGKATHGSWITEKKLNILVQLSLQKHPDLPDVPLIVDLAKTDDDRRILTLIFARQVMARPFLAPPATPPHPATPSPHPSTPTIPHPPFTPSP